MTLEARALTIAWPSVGEVLRAVDLRCEPGRFLALVGPNGAGKSSLLRALAGLVPPAAGEVLLDGRAIGSWPLPARARVLGFLPQEVTPAFSFTVREAVALGERVAGRPTGERALADVAAGDLGARRLDSLSGGERRRVLVASVLAQEPRWLLLDEPTAMLDWHHQADLFRLLRRLAGGGIGVLCATHDLNLAARFCDRMLLLHGGRVAADAEPEEMLRSPALHAAFAGALEQVRDGAGRLAVLPRA